MALSLQEFRESQDTRPSWKSGKTGQYRLQSLEIHIAQNLERFDGIDENYESGNDN